MDMNVELTSALDGLTEYAATALRCDSVTWARICADKATIYAVEFIRESYAGNLPRGSNNGCYNLPSAFRHL